MMKFRHLIAGALLAAGLCAAHDARAAQGYAVTAVNLRAGPGRDYPVVARIPAGAPLGIGGCTAGLAYCDVDFQGIHGWTSARHLQFVEGRRRVYVYQAAPAVFPVVVFNQGDYWGRYYRDRPFYRDWHRNAPPPHPPGPPPRAHAYPLYQPQPPQPREDHSHGWDWVPQNQQPHERDWDR